MLVKYIEQRQGSSWFTSSPISVEKGDLGIHSFVPMQRKQNDGALGDLDLTPPISRFRCGPGSYQSLYQPIRFRSLWLPGILTAVASHLASLQIASVEISAV